MCKETLHVRIQPEVRGGVGAEQGWGSGDGGLMCRDGHAWAHKPLIIGAWRGTHTWCITCPGLQQKSKRAWNVVVVASAGGLGKAMKAAPASRPLPPLFGSPSPCKWAPGGMAGQYGPAPAAAAHRRGQLGVGPPCVCVPVPVIAGEGRGSARRRPVLLLSRNWGLRVRQCTARCARRPAKPSHPVGPCLSLVKSSIIKAPSLQGSQVRLPAGGTEPPRLTEPMSHRHNANSSASLLWSPMHAGTGGQMAGPRLQHEPRAPLCPPPPHPTHQSRHPAWRSRTCGRGRG